MDHKICVYGGVWLIIPKLSLLPLLIWSTDYCTTVQCQRIDIPDKLLSSLKETFQYDRQIKKEDIELS